jgi:hypothetical protein
VVDEANLRDKNDPHVPTIRKNLIHPTDQALMRGLFEFVWFHLFGRFR